jgi:DNA primase
MTTRDDWLETVKRELDPHRLASALGLKGRGRRYFCPACQAAGGRTPDLAPSAKGFICHKCGAKGDLVALVQLALGCDFPAALDWLAVETNHPRPSSRGSSAAKRRTATPRAIPAPVVAPSPTVPPDRVAVLRAFLDGCRPVEGKALAYLTNRGIDAAVVHRLGVKFCGREYADLMGQLEQRVGTTALADAGLLTASMRGTGWYPTFRPFTAKQIGFLVLPYQLHGEPVYLKARPPLSKAATEAKGVARFLNTGGTVPCLYNADVLDRPIPRVLICEGETDTLTALTHGYDAVGIPGWSAFKAAWLEGFRGKAVYLVLDADAAGDRGVRDIARTFERGGLPLPKHVVLPPGTDLNEFMKDGMTA